MNKRIRELADQAGLYDFVVESMGVDEEMNKFAELIVAECADLCELYAMPDGTNFTAMLLAKAIRKRFGVEE